MTRTDFVKIVPTLIFALILLAFSYVLAPVYAQANTTNTTSANATPAKQANPNVKNVGSGNPMSTTTSAGPTNTAHVSIVKGASSPDVSKSYDPTPLTVRVGTAVIWKNNDFSLHTVTSGLPEQGAVGTLFDSSLINPGMTFSHTFNKTGTFDYSCTLHPFMHGQIIVK